MGGANLTDILAVVAILFGAGGVVTVVVDKLFSKPSDRQAEIEFSVTVLKELLQEQREGVQVDRARWLEQEKFLREELAKADRQDQAQRERIAKLVGLLTDARERISELGSELDKLQDRIANLAEKHARGQAITLGDILGPEAVKHVNDVTKERRDNERQADAENEGAK